MEIEEEEDCFLRFIAYAKSTLDTCDLRESPGWGWIANHILRTCARYPTGVTPAILLSEISMAWSEQNRSRPQKKQFDCIVNSKKKPSRTKLPNSVTIDSIYEKKYLALSSVIEAVIINAYTLPGTNIYMLTLGDAWSSNTIDLYLHKRFYSIADPTNGILKTRREVLLTGCYIRMGAGNSVSVRLLPTEYLVVILDGDEDDDAMLLGAQFCSDSFSLISLDAVKKGTSYSLYSRIEHIGPLEIQGKYCNLQRRQITLVDNDGLRLKFLLWGEQVRVANLFSVGSMLAIDRPFIASATDSSPETSDEIFLEYGSATQLYIVPIFLHKEQVCLALTQNPCQGSRMLTASNLSQGHSFSEVTLPCDSMGIIDFSNYPFKTYVADLRDKMTGVSLYGVITEIRASKGTFSLKIEDTTGAILVKLHFVKHWSLGRLATGHVIYISGLSSLLSPENRLELLWDQSGNRSSFFNLSSSLAILNSSCFQRVVSLSCISTHASHVQVLRVWVDRVEHCHVDTRLMHTRCGHLTVKAPFGDDVECKFCDRICTGEVERTFRLKITLADDTAKVVGWCVGKTASELLQICPDEFYNLPEEEQIMYPASIEHEMFVVAIVRSSRMMDEDEDRMGDWEVTLAIKCD